MASASSNIKMAISTLENGSTIVTMEKAFISAEMVKGMKVKCVTAKETDKEFTTSKMVESIEACGKTTSSSAQEPKKDLFTAIKVNGSKENGMEEGY